MFQCLWPLVKIKLPKISFTTGVSLKGPSRRCISLKWRVNFSKINWFQCYLELFQNRPCQYSTIKEHFFKQIGFFQLHLEPVIGSGHVFAASQLLIHQFLLHEQPAPAWNISSLLSYINGYLLCQLSPRGSVCIGRTQTHHHLILRCAPYLCATAHALFTKQIQNAGFHEKDLVE